MTTIEIFERVGRRAKGNDFTKLDLLEKRDVLQAVNQGLQVIYDAIPMYFKEITEGFALPAPSTVTLTVTNGSNVVSSAVFSNAQLGQSVVIPGDPAWNQVIGPSTLLNPYLGPSGTYVATVYGDAFYSTRFPFDRILGNPKFNNQSYGPLVRTEMNRASIDGVNNITLFQQSIGLPRIWWVQPLGASQGNEPLLVMRFLPAPDQAYSMSVRASYWAKRLTDADYQAGNVVPISDQFIEVALIPLAIQAFRSSPVFDRQFQDDKFLDQQALDAKAFLAHQPANPNSPNNRVGTPYGY